MMNGRWNRSGLAAAAVLLLVASVASAKFPSLGKSTAKSADLEITSATRVASGPELQPGSYKVSLVNSSGSPEVAFYRNGNLVAQGPVKLVDEGKKNQQTEIESNTETHELIQMRLKGWNQTFVFVDPGPSSNSGQ